MYTRLKKRFSIATCLFFILISCVITHQLPNRLAANEEDGHRQKPLSIWLTIANDENLKHLENGNTKGFEQEKLWKYNFGENGAIASSLTRFDDREGIDATVRQKENNTYNYRRQSDDDDDDDNNDDNDDDDYHYGNVLFDDPTDAGRPSPSFQDDILPILTNRCAFAGCHVAGGPGGIDLRTYDAVIAGGSKGAIVIAGDAGESELVKQIVEGKMPPGGPPLPAAQIQLITDWINDGAKNNLNGEVDREPLIPPDSFSPPDVNRDGVVDVLDLIQAALQFGQVGTHLAGDVNGNGTVDVADLILISAGLSGNVAMSAPPVDDSNPTTNYHSSSVKRQFQALVALESLATPSREARLARDMLKAWLSRMKPLITETKLLPNYPNPFNPETWIPYQLAETTYVKIHIYDVAGYLVRTLDLGTKPVGNYLSREQAAYWDGRNDMGEGVSSGVYFYTLATGDYQTTRRMIVTR